MTTLSLIVENSAGVLNKVSGLISRRGFNIESLAVGKCHQEHSSRITIVVNCDEATLKQMINQIAKLYCVQEISVLKQGEEKSRELMLIKVEAQNGNRNEIVQICNIFEARIIEATKDTIMIEFVGDIEKESAFMSLIDQYKIIELARTGVIALAKEKH